MYQALQYAYDELGTLPTDKALTKKMFILLNNGFSEAVKGLNNFAQASKTEQDSKNIKKLCDGIMASGRIINHIWNAQLKN